MWKLLLLFLAYLLSTCYGYFTLSNLLTTGSYLVKSPINFTAVFTCVVNSTCQGSITGGYLGLSTDIYGNNILIQPDPNASQTNGTGIGIWNDVEFGRIGWQAVTIQYPGNLRNYLQSWFWSFTIDIRPASTLITFNTNLAEGDHNFTFSFSINQALSALTEINETQLTLYINQQQVEKIPLSGAASCEVSKNYPMSLSQGCHDGGGSSQVYHLPGLSEVYGVYSDGVNSITTPSQLVDGCTSLDCDACRKEIACGWCEESNITSFQKCRSLQFRDTCTATWYEDQCPTYQSLDEIIIVACILSIVFGCFCFGLLVWVVANTYYRGKGKVAPGTV